MRQLDIQINVDNASANRALGETDKKLNDVEQGAKQVGTAASSATDTLARMGTVTAGVFSAMAIGELLDTLIRFGKELIADADALMKLHDATGLSLAALQQIQIVTDDVGGSLQNVAKAAEFLQRSIAGGNNSTVDALQRLGLSLQDIRNMSPDEQFFTVAKAMQGVTDQEDLMYQGTKLMGRGFAETLPAIKNGFDDVRKSASLMSDETIAALDKLGDRMTAAFRYLKFLGGEILADFLTLSTSVQRAQADALNKTLEGMRQSAQKALPVLTPDALVPPGLVDGLDAVTKGLDAMAQQHLAESKAAAEATRQHDAYLRKLDAVNQKILEATRDTGNLTDQQEDASVMYRRLGLSVEDISIKLNISAIAIKKFLDVHDVMEAHIERLTEHVDAKAIPAFSGLLMTWEQMMNTGKGLTYDGLLPMAKGFDDVARAEQAAEEWAKRLQRSNEALQGQLATTIGLMPDLSKEAAEHMNAATASTEKWGKAIDETSRLLSRLAGADLGPLIAQFVKLAEVKFGGGGGTSGAPGSGGVVSGGVLGGLLGAQAASGGTSSGAALAKVGIGAGVGVATGLMTGAAIGATVAIGAATLGIGAAVIGVVALINHLKGISEEEKHARETWGEFQKQFGTLDQTIQTVGAAYEKFGHTGVEAQQDLQAALDATHVSAEAEAIALEKINGVLRDGKQDAEDLDKAIQKYGFSIAELGPTMQRQQLTAQAVQLENDFRLLAGSGINVNTVLEHMGGSINDFLHLAQQTGSEVPREMQPILQKMIDLGQLTDENGVAITDMSQIGVTFSETMTQGFDRVVNKLEELLVKIGLVPEALAQIPTQIDINVQGHYIAPDIPDAGYDPNLASYHAGGAILPFVVRAHRGLAVDEVPIIAQTGEGVLNRGAMRRIGGSSGLNRLNAGGGGGGITINVGEGAVQLSQDMSESQARDLVGGTIIREIRRKGGRFAA